MEPVMELRIMQRAPRKINKTLCIVEAPGRSVKLEGLDAALLVADV